MKNKIEKYLKIIQIKKFLERNKIVYIPIEYKNFYIFTKNENNHEIYYVDLLVDYRISKYLLSSENYEFFIFIMRKLIKEFILR